MLGKLPNSASMFSPTDLPERPQALFLGEMENLLRCEDEKNKLISLQRKSKFSRHKNGTAKKLQRK